MVGKTLLWMDQFDQAGANDRAVALEGGRTLAAGVGTTPKSEDLLVRVYER